MKLALKLVAVCLAAMILITAFTNYWIAKREYQLVQELQQSNAERIGGQIRESIDVAYNSEGNRGILKIMRTYAVDTGDIQYRWVWFDASVSDSTHPAAPLESLEKIIGGEMSSVVTAREGPDLLYTYYPMDVNDQSVGKPRRGAIEISGSLRTAEEEAWRATKTGLLAMSAMALFCLAFVALAGVRFIGRPLKILTEQTRLIGRGIYDRPVQLNTKDEFGELSQALNAMSRQIAEQQQRIESETAARLSTLNQLRHADRLKTVGRLAAGVAHEIGTPLNVISGRAGLICSGKLSPQELEESAAAIRSESDRITVIVRQLMGFARRHPPERKSVDVRIVIERTIDLLRTMAAKRNVTVILNIPVQEPFTAFVDASQIQQVFTNLIENAIHAITDNGSIEVSLENIDDQLVRVQIRDDGPGMDSETLNQIFEPFFTTKEVGQGTGLGLSIAHGIVQEHGGEIEVDSQPGRGTTFRILLPKSGQNQPANVND